MSVGEFWPEKGVLSCDWTLKLRQSVPFGLSGNSVAVEHGEPYWMIDVSVAAPPQSSLARSWSAFMRRRKGQAVSFTANRSFQSFPANGTITTDVGLSVASIDRAASTITLAGADSELSQPSDMIGFYTAENGFYVGEIDAVVSGSTYAVSPLPFEPHASTANPRRIKALGEFRMIADYAPKESYNSWSLSFKATQVIRG